VLRRGIFKEVEMKKSIAVVAAAIVLMISGQALSQQVETWKDIDWQCLGTGAIEVTAEDSSLVLNQGTPENNGLLLASYCTYDLTEFRSATTPWVEVSFKDQYPEVRSSVQLWIRDECPPAESNFITQIGADAQNEDEDDTYFIQWCNPYQDQGKCLRLNTNKERSAGIHTIRIGRQEDGTVEYYIDNELLWSTKEIPSTTYTYVAPEYFGNIILMGQFSSATFTDYKFGAEYSQSSPPPPPLQSPLAVDIDIKPFSHKNKIYRWERGTIPVAVLSRADFDAPREVDKASLTFGRTGDEDSKVFFLRRGKDVNRDGLRDLIFFFRAKRAGFQVGDKVGVLKGSTLKGQEFEGQDAVNIVAKRRWWPFKRSDKH
jgi:hypothetical protein